MNFHEARGHVRKLGLKTGLDYREWAKTTQRPKNIPTNPWEVYKEDLLATDPESTRKRAPASAQWRSSKDGKRRTAAASEGSWEGNRPAGSRPESCKDP